MSALGVEELARLIETKSKAYDHLELLCLCYPGRISGSHILESALSFLEELGRETMHLDTSIVPAPNCPQWVRGSADEEKFEFDITVPEGVWPEPDPSHRIIRVLANGMSVGTEKEGVQGSVISVDSIEKLNKLGEADLLRGKIVLYDWRSYSQYGLLSGPFRGEGANSAAKYGASGVLIRSIAPDGSTSGLHTGSMSPYKDGAIPAACVTQEDAELITRLLKRGYDLFGRLSLPCRLMEPVTHRNIIFEIPGETDECVIIGGHTDSWECHHLGCQGAHDDGQGVIVCMETLRILKETGIKPKRTIKAVLWVDEECRQTGAKAYFDSLSQEELSKIYVCMETDLGAGPVIGFGFSGGEGGAAVMQTILSPMDALDVSKNQKAKVDSNNKGMTSKCNVVNSEWPGYGVDTYPLVVNGGVPGILLRHEDTWWFNDYFHHHHTTSDTIDHVDKDLLMLNMQCVAAATWLCANTDQVLPRKQPEPDAVREKRLR